MPRSILHHDLFAHLCEGVGARVVPIFNTGVMLFRNGVHRTLGRCIEEMMRLRAAFARKALPFPCANVRLFDEVLGALILGRVPGLTWNAIPPQLVPFYEEMRSGSLASAGLVLHVWSNRYADFLAAEEGSKAAHEYLAIPPHGVRKDWLFSAWMRAGVSRLQLPPTLLARWARNSRWVLPESQR